MTILQQPMSSTKFVTALEPEPRLRQIVLLSACAALLAGTALLIRLPVSPWIRLGLTLAWIFFSAREIGAFSRGIQRTRLIRLGLGYATVSDRYGRERPVQIMSGSVVLPTVAWLRLKFADGLAYGELLRCKSAEDQHWRRLQILWRLGPGFFGRTAEADTITNPKTRSHFQAKTP